MGLYKLKRFAKKDMTLTCSWKRKELAFKKVRKVSRHHDTRLLQVLEDDVEYVFRVPDFFDIHVIFERIREHAIRNNVLVEEQEKRNRLSSKKEDEPIVPECDSKNE